MSFKPILFNGEMVKAILEGRKTQTRRIVKGVEALNVYHVEPAEDAYDTLHQWDFFYGWHEGGACFDAIESVKGPCSVGDILWVRETWCKGRVEYGGKPDGRNVPYISQCVGDDRFIPKEWAVRNDIGLEDVVWKPSIHMPKQAARIFLRVKDVRVERLKDIKNHECVNEGAVKKPNITKRGDLVLHNRYKEEFARLWDTTIKPADRERYGWNANPWVWVIEFERCGKPKGWL